MESNRRRRTVNDSLHRLVEPPGGDRNAKPRDKTVRRSSLGNHAGDPNLRIPRMPSKRLKVGVALTVNEP